VGCGVCVCVGARSGAPPSGSRLSSLPPDQADSSRKCNGAASWRQKPEMGDGRNLGAIGSGAGGGLAERMMHETRRQ
jgi:hypothetical protein